MAKDTVEIKGFSTADLARAEQIHDLARPIELEGSCDPRGFVPLAKDKSDHAEFLSAKKYVAVLNNEVVGFVGTQPQEIGWLYVDPAYFAQGIGRKLLQHGLTQLASNNKAIEVHVLSDNDRATKLYESEGFVEASRFESKNNGYPCTVIKLVRA